MLFVIEQGLILSWASCVSALSLEKCISQSMMLIFFNSSKALWGNSADLRAGWPRDERHAQSIVAICEGSFELFHSGAFCTVRFTLSFNGAENRSD